MRKSLLKLLGIIVAFMLSTSVAALGMGGINVTSSLGQPLSAEIELVAPGNEEKTSLVARLAAPDVYAGAGLEYPYGNKFAFEIDSRPNGDPYLKVSSGKPVNDPFVSLLVELTWSSGKLLREYTFLLDPPDYVAEQPKSAEVQPVAPEAQAAPAEEVAAPAEPMPEPAEAAPAPAAEGKPAPAPAPKPAAVPPARETAKPIPSGDITVKRGDTLNKIARENKPADVSLERMLVALYRANADQFDGKNMNRIKTGKILRLPEHADLMSVKQAEAMKEIRAQTADWNTYRQKLAGAAAAATVEPTQAKQVASGKIASSVADQKPVAKESAKEVLKLSKGEAPGDKAVAGGGKDATAQDKKNAAKEEAIAKAKAAEEEKKRAAVLEKNLQDMKRLAELKSELAASTPAPAAAASGVTVTEEAMPAKEAKPKAKPKPKAPPPPVVQPEPSLIDEILGEPLYLAGGAAVLLGLGGLGFMLARRKGGKAGKAAGVAASAAAVQDVGVTTGQIAVPVAPSPETGDFTVHADATEAAEGAAEDVDPLSEADLFLNFGRDAQAEEILKEALRNTPGNHQIHLKLLGIYFNRKDVNAFAGIAQQLLSSGNEEAWQQAAAMGRKLEPNNPMYGGGSAGFEAADSATMQTMALGATPEFVVDDTPVAAEPALDFDLGAEAPAAAPSAMFDNAEKTVIFSAEDMAAAQAAPMDFDVTATSPSLEPSAAIDFDIGAVLSSPATDTASVDLDTGAAEAPAATEQELPNLDDLIFDVTATQPAMQAETPQPAADSGETVDDGFTLDFPVAESVEAPVVVSAEASSLADISLNLDDIDTSPAQPAGSAVHDDHWHEVATKLDLARAYQEMGDATGAREILEEVLSEGDAEQQAAAQAILDQLG